jgi:hypothetical protein
MKGHKSMKLTNDNVLWFKGKRKMSEEIYSGIPVAGRTILFAIKMLSICKLFVKEP